MNTFQYNFFRLVNSSLRFRMFLFYKLPAAFFSGIKIKEIAEDKCITSVPFKWLTQNPFQSIYFASLAMAAEMSTGLLCMSNTYKQTPVLSMLVIKMEAAYFKKATGIIYFICEDGNEIKAVVAAAIKTGESKSITTKSTGKNQQGEFVAEFLFTWSFKVKPDSKPA